jgi:hypothetical protein
MLSRLQRKSEALLPRISVCAVLHAIYIIQENKLHIHFWFQLSFFFKADYARSCSRNVFFLCIKGFLPGSFFGNIAIV